MPYSAALSAAAVDMKGMANDERGFLMTGDPEFRDEIAERAGKIRDELAAAAKAGDSEAVEAITAKFDAWAEALAGTAEQLAGLVQRFKVGA